MSDYLVVVNPPPVRPASRETWAAARLAHNRPGRRQVKPRRKARHIAHGHTDHQAMKQIMIAFDDDTFAELRGVATRQRRSFASVVRDFVEWGMLEYQLEGTRL